MKIKKIIREEVDEFDWIRDIGPSRPMPITKLMPNDKYIILTLSDKAIDEIADDDDVSDYLEDNRIYEEIFQIDSSGGFYSTDNRNRTDYADEFTTDFWLIDSIDSDRTGAWISVKGVTVQIVY